MPVGTALARGLGQIASSASIGPSVGASSSNISTRVSSRQSNSRKAEVPNPVLAPVTRQQLARTARRSSHVSARRSAVLAPEADEGLALTHEVGLGFLGTAAAAGAGAAFQLDSRGNGCADRHAAEDAASVSAIPPAAALAALEGIPPELHCLLDSTASVALPAPGSLSPAALDNSRLDRLVAALGRGRATWRRALLLYEWLKASGHRLDDRLCTTLIRVCADHGDAVSALAVYEWMKAPAAAGGAALHPTAYTYTAAMRAALAAGMLDRAHQVWNDSQAAGLTPDCRLCITYIELCTRLGMTDKALDMYYQMRDSSPGSPMRPSVHAYTAAMRAATEGGRWQRALGVWEDMRRSSCQPTGHAYAAAISACAAGQDWQRAVALFDDMTARAGIRPDVVSCTALVTALASAGQADKAEAVVLWMHKAGLKPNVRTYTALLTAMGNARQWSRAVRLLFTMQQPENGSVQPNAYTYSALIKALGEHGQWQLAEAVFEDVESQVRTARAQACTSDASSSSSSSSSMASSSTSATPMSPPSMPLTAQQTPAQRAQVFQRLMAVAVAAEAAQQLLAAQSQLAAAAGGVPAGMGMGVGAAATTGPEQVVQLLPLVDSASVSHTSSTQGQGAASKSHNPASGTASSSNSSSVVMPATPTRQVTAGAVGSIGVGATSMQDASPSTPSTPMPPTPGSQLTSGAAGSLERGEGATATPRNWSHPSQLNGIQLDLLGAGRSEQPAPAGALLAAAAATPALAPSRPVPELSLLPVQPIVAPVPVPVAGEYLFTSAQVALGAPSYSTSAPGPQHDKLWGDSGSGSGSASAGFSLFSSQPTRTGDVGVAREGGSDARAGSSQQQGGAGLHAGAQTPVLNEVVCGAMMLAYERGGRWVEAVGMLGRARMLGLVPNTVMFNMAISAAGKAGQVELAEQLFASCPARDAVTCETLVAAYGMAGQADKAEQMLRQMVQWGHRPRDYAYCGLIAAHSLAGHTDAALGVRQRMQAAGLQPTVHVYNALLAACERAYRYEHALDLLHTMKREGVEPNAVTSQLMGAIGRHGAQSVESQQVAAAALSAVFAAAGGLLIRAGLF